MPLDAAIRRVFVVACCKSKRKQPGPGGTGFEAEQEKETYPLPGTKENPIVQVGKGRNYYLTSFKLASLALLSKNHKKVLPGTSLFHPEASVNKPNQVKENGPHDPPHQLPHASHPSDGHGCWRRRRCGGFGHFGGEKNVEKRGVRDENLEQLRITSSQPPPEQLGLTG